MNKLQSRTVNVTNVTISKKHIEALKQEDLRFIYDLLTNKHNKKSVMSTLKYLGRLPDSFDATYLLPLLYDKDHRMRYLAVKNIAKLKADRYLDAIVKRAKIENNSNVKREMISAIGRMRSAKAIPYLINTLQDNDPKVVLQAIRGLLLFKSNDSVITELKKLIMHPNEMIQEIIQREFYPIKQIDNTMTDHLSSPEYMKNTIVCGDVRTVLDKIPDESIHLTFTSPPYYNARDYSFYKSYDEYLEFLNEVFGILINKTKEGRFFVLNTSPIIIPRVSRQHSSKRYSIPFDIHPYLTKLGWEFIDDIVWVKPETTAKNRTSGFNQTRKPLAYKPNPVTEYLMVYRKKSDRLIDWNIRQYDDDTISKSKVLGEYDRSNVWYIDPKFDKVHSAVFPIELCKRVIKYYSYRNDLIFDPFAGSGTVGKAALEMGRSFFLTECSAQYIDRMEENFEKEILLSKPKITFMDAYKLYEIVKNDS